MLRNSAPWRDLPQKEFGPWQTVYGGFHRWSFDGTLDEIVDRLQAARTDTETFDPALWCIGGTVVRARRRAAGAEKRPA